MHSLKSIKHIFLFFFTFFLGEQIHYAKSELIIPTKSISLSIEKAHIFGSLAKEVFLESLDENWQPVGELVTPEGYRFAMHDDRSISERVLSIVKDSQGKYRAGVKILGKGDLKSLSQWMDELSDQKLLQRLNNLSDAQKIKLNTYLSKAKTDLDANAFKQFKKALQQKNGIEAWKLIDKAIGNKTITKFAYDAKTLTKVAQMSDAKSNFRKALGVDWEKELQAILKNNSDLKCNACGNKGRSYRSSMDEFLEEIDYFVANFDIRHSNKGKKLFQWAKGRGVDGKLIKNFQDLPIADELSQHLTYIKKQGFTGADIVDFGKSIGRTKKKTDITMAHPPPLYRELKSLKEGSDGLDDLAGDVMSGLNKNPLKNRKQFVDQFINGYLKEIRSLKDLEYIFEARKLGPNGEKFIKEQFKELFLARKEEIFETLWNNESLRGDLFDLTDGALQAPIQQFDDLVSNSRSKLYDFIKAQ